MENAVIRADLGEFKNLLGNIGITASDLKLADIFESLSRDVLDGTFVGDILEVIGICFGDRSHNKLRRMGDDEFLVRCGLAAAPAPFLAPPCVQEAAPAVPSATADSAPAVRELCPGIAVRIHSLVGKPALNGQVAVLIRYIKRTSRWEILINDSRDHITVKPCNLQRVDSRITAVCGVCRNDFCDGFDGGPVACCPFHPHDPGNLVSREILRPANADSPSSILSSSSNAEALFSPTLKSTRASGPLLCSQALGPPHEPENDHDHVYDPSKFIFDPRDPRHPENGHRLSCSCTSCTAIDEAIEWK